MSADDVGIGGVAIAYLFAYPFTILPFSGLGVVDALVLAAIVEIGGVSLEATAVAGLIVWRVFTVACPVVMGLVAMVGWRRGWAGGGSAQEAG